MLAWALCWDRAWQRWAVEQGRAAQVGGGRGFTEVHGAAYAVSWLANFCTLQGARVIPRRLAISVASSTLPVPLRMRMLPRPAMAPWCAGGNCRSKCSSPLTGEGGRAGKGFECFQPINVSCVCE